MQRTRRRRSAQRLSPDSFSFEHPFVRWYAGHHSRGAARCVGRPQGDGRPPAGDLLMGELAARRFSVGIDDDRVPVLGVAEGDADAVMALEWSSAAFLRRVQGRDWIALACRDARIEGARADGAVGLRLWLPSTLGLLDGWIGAPAPSALRVVEAAIRQGKPIAKSGPPLAILPLSLKGVWEAPATAPEGAAA